jgi:hypothetical protein
MVKKGYYLCRPVRNGPKPGEEEEGNEGRGKE